MPRIVTLLAAATEIVAAVGAGEELVGVSHECDHPPGAVAGRPVLTTARVGPLPSSASVDRSVRQLVADALAVYDIDAELLAALAPDVIVPKTCAGSARSASTTSGPRSPSWPPTPTCGWSPCTRAALATSSTTSPGSRPRSPARPLGSGWWPGCEIGSSGSGPWRAGR